MAGCCPSIPQVTTSRANSAEANGPESDIRPKENVDCYMKRGGNTTGQHDDATDNVDNKIENSSIPLSQNPVRFDNIQFRLTAGSTATAASWEWSNNGGANPSLLGVSLTSGGLLTGNIGSGALGQTFKMTVTAKKADASIIDERTFVFSPQTATKSDEIRLVSPLPGAIVNSKFGPRLHPIQKVMKPHNGIDMKFQDRSVKDVVAAADGEVVFAGGDASRGYGIRCIIRHRASDGKHMCDTTYNHLNRLYIKVGQKVMAGQAVGLEGTTGSSTGNHLHFECKLPNGTFIDPEPLINGSITVARKTLPNGDADTTSTETKNSSASLTPAEADARAAGCEAFGPDYPPDPATEGTDPVPPSTDPFEQAWFLTMTEEVGPFWDASYPNDPDVQAGLIDTAARRKKVGYVNSPGFPGGETKFGIAQSPNPNVDVTTIDYAASKQMGYNTYWKRSAISCEGKPARLAIMLFDMNYLHGPGNARKMWNDALAAGMNPTGTTDAEQTAACEILNSARVRFIRSIPRPEYTKGWLNRAAHTLQYVKSISV